MVACQIKRRQLGALSQVVKFSCHSFFNVWLFVRMHFFHTIKINMYRQSKFTSKSWHLVTEVIHSHLQVVANREDEPSNALLFIHDLLTYDELALQIYCPDVPAFIIGYRNNCASSSERFMNH